MVVKEELIILAFTSALPTNRHLITCACKIYMLQADTTRNYFFAGHKMFRSQSIYNKISFLGLSAH